MGCLVGRGRIRIRVLDSDLVLDLGLGTPVAPRSSASHKSVGLTQKIAADPVAPWSASTNKAINHWSCRRSSGRPPPNWVEQLHAVRLWEHHILPFGVSDFGVRCLSIVVRMPILAPSTTPIRPLPLLGNALAGSALFHEQLCSTAVGHLNTRPVSGVSVAPAWQNIASPYGDLTNASFVPSSPAAASWMNQQWTCQRGWHPFWTLRPMSSACGRTR